MKFRVTDPSGHLWMTSGSRITYRDVGKDVMPTLRLGTPALVFAKRQNVSLDDIFSAILGCKPTA